MVVTTYSAFLGVGCWVLGVGCWVLGWVELGLKFDPNQLEAETGRLSLRQVKHQLRRRTGFACSELKDSVGRRERTFYPLLGISV